MLGFLILLCGCNGAELVLDDARSTEPTVDFDVEEPACNRYWLETIRWNGEIFDDPFCFPTRPVVNVSGGEVTYNPDEGAPSWTVNIQAAPEGPLVYHGSQSRIVMHDRLDSGWTTQIPWERTTLSLSDGTVIASGAGNPMTWHRSGTECETTLYLDLFRQTSDWMLLPITGIRASGTLTITVTVELGLAVPSSGDTIQFDLDGTDHWSAPPSIPEVITVSEPASGILYVFP